MSYSVRSTRKSERTFDDNLSYLEKEWDHAAIIKFLNRVDEVKTEISKNPFLFPVFENDIRKAVINKRVVLYYKIIDKKTIRLLVFRNTHRDPKKLKF